MVVEGEKGSGTIRNRELLLVVAAYNMHRLCLYAMVSTWVSALFRLQVSYVMLIYKTCPDVLKVELY